MAQQARTRDRRKQPGGVVAAATAYPAAPVAALLLTALAACAGPPPAPEDPPGLDGAAWTCDGGKELSGHRIRLAEELDAARLQAVPVRLGPLAAQRLLDRGWDLKRADREPGLPVVLLKNPATLRVPPLPCPGAATEPVAWIRMVETEGPWKGQRMNLSLSSAGGEAAAGRLGGGRASTWMRAVLREGDPAGALLLRAEREGEAALAEVRLPLGSLQMHVAHEYRQAVVGSSIRRAEFTVVPPPGARLRFSLGVADESASVDARPASHDDSSGGGDSEVRGDVMDGPVRDADGQSPAAPEPARAEAAPDAPGRDPYRRTDRHQPPVDDPGWRFVVRAGDGDGPEVVFSEIVTSHNAMTAAPWLEREVDLSQWSGQPIHLSLETEPVGEPESLALWGSPVVEGSGPGGTTSPAPPGAPAGVRRPNILLVSLDTLRADRVGRVAHGIHLTPELERLAARGTRFTSARTQAPSTLYGHASMLTGLPPAGHGATTRSMLPPGVPYLPEILAREGYATVAIGDDGLLDGRYGFARSFDRFRSVAEAIEGKTDLALEALEDLREPWFLLFHSYTVHMPYAPPLGYAEPLLDAGYDGPLGSEIDAPLVKKTVSWMNQGRTPVTEADLRRLKALYDGEVRRADHEVGRILRRLEAMGVLDDTIVVVTADHGEELDEHGVVAWHALTCYEELMRVPLIVKPAAGGPGAGSPRSVATAVRLMDVAPTILALAGLAPHAAMAGRSLAGLMAGASEPDRESLCEVEDARGAALLKDGWKYHMRARWSVEDPRTPRRRLQQRGRYGAEELYDLAADPGEQVNVAERHPERAREMREILQARLREATDLLASLTRNDPASRAPREDQEHLERLRALGYVE